MLHTAWHTARLAKARSHCPEGCRTGDVPYEHTFEGNIMNTMTATAISRDALLGPSAQRLEVGLMAARTAAVLRRVIERLPLDHVDQEVLRAASDVMARTATAVETLVSGGQMPRDRRSLGFGAMAFTVEHAAPAVTPAKLPEYLRWIADALTRAEEDPNREAAERLLPIFSTIADEATRMSGTVGEGSGSIF